MLAYWKEFVFLAVTGTAMTVAAVLALSAASRLVQRFRGGRGH
jgi:hypothetical protein